MNVRGTFKLQETQSYGFPERLAWQVVRKVQRHSKNKKAEADRKSLLPPYIFSLKSAVKCKTTARKQSSNALRCWGNYAPAFSFLSRADFFLAAVFLCRIPFAAAWSILLTATLTASALSAALDSIAALAFLISVLS